MTLQEADATPERVPTTSGVEDTFEPYHDAIGDESDEERPLPLLQKKSRKGPGTVLCIVLGIGVALVFLTLSAIRIFLHGAATSRVAPTQRPAKAVDWALNFPRLYPAIEDTASPECQTAWKNLTSVPCHSKIFDRSRDNGAFRIMGFDPMHFVPIMCRADCRMALKAAHRLVSEKCSVDAKFNIKSYSGMFNTTFLESSPAAAIEVLLKRSDHTCRKIPSGGSDYEYCPIELQERFGIVDGMNAHELEGVEQFMQQTSRRRIEPAGRKSGVRGTSKYRHRYNFMVREQHYGPGIGETTCGWCMLDYFTRRLNSWEDGAVMSPDSNLPVSLPEFLRRMRAAGQRCEQKQWDKIFNNAVTKYQKAGAIPQDWELLPSGDLQYLIKHGIGQGDEPIPSIYAAKQQLEEEQETALRHTINRMGKECLTILSSHLLSLPCYIYVDRSTLGSMIQESGNFPGLSKSYCSDACANGLQSLGLPKSCTLPAVRDHPLIGPFLNNYDAAKATWDRVCTDSTTRTGPRGYCSKQFSTMGREDWVFDGRPDTSVFVDQLGIELAKLKEKPIPQEIKPLSPGDRVVEPKERNALRTYNKWIQELETSVCSSCIWAWLVGNGDTNTVVGYLETADSADEYISFVRSLYDTCASLGAKDRGGLPYGDDPVIWRVQTESGDVHRYREVTKGWDKGKVVRANEATDEVYTSPRKWGSVWHLLAAKREFDAMQEGSVLEWRKKEMAHRDEEDAKVWDLNAVFGIRWLPKNERKDGEKIG